MGIAQALAYSFNQQDRKAIPNRSCEGLVEKNDAGDQNSYACAQTAVGARSGSVVTRCAGLPSHASPATPVELAAASGLSKSTVTAAGNGRALLEIQTVIAIARGLGVTPADVVTFPEDSDLDAVAELLRELPEAERSRAVAKIRRAHRSASRREAR